MQSGRFRIIRKSNGWYYPQRKLWFGTWWPYYKFEALIGGGGGYYQVGKRTVEEAQYSVEQWKEELKPRRVSQREIFMVKTSESLVDRMRSHASLLGGFCGLLLVFPIVFLAVDFSNPPLGIFAFVMIPVSMGISEGLWAFWARHNQQLKGKKLSRY